MIQVCIHKNYKRSWTKDCNLRFLQGHMNEWRGTGSRMYSIDISVLIYSKRSFLYADCGDNIKGHAQMSFKPPTTLSFTCLESGTWFPSFLATRSGHRQRSGEGSLLSISFFLPETCKMHFNHEHENHTKDGNTGSWKEAEFLTTLWNPRPYLSQCFWVLYYLQLNIFLTSSLIIIFIIFYIIMKH